MLEKGPCMFEKGPCMFECLGCHEYPCQGKPLWDLCCCYLACCLPGALQPRWWELGRLGLGGVRACLLCCCACAAGKVTLAEGALPQGLFSPAKSRVA